MANQDSLTQSLVKAFPAATEDRKTSQTVGKAAPQSSFSPANLLHSAAQIPGAAARAVGSAVFGAPARLGQDLEGIMAGKQQIASINASRDQLDALTTQLHQNYASGKINKDAFNNGLKNITKQQLQLSDQASKVGKTYRKPTDALKDVASTVGTVATLAAPVLDVPAIGGTAGKVVGAASKELKVGEALAGKEGPGALLSLGGKLVRNAVVTQPTVQTGEQIIHDFQTKNVKDLGLQTALFAGIPAASKAIGAIAPVLKDLFSAQRSFMTELKFKDGTIADAISAAKTSAEKQKLINQAKVAVEHYKAEGRTPGDIANYESVKLGDQTVTEFLQRQEDLAKATGKFQKAAKAGKLTFDSKGNQIPADLHELVGAGRLSSTEKSDLITRLGEAKDFSARNAILEADKAAGRDYTRNQNVFEKVKFAIRHDDNPDAIAKEIGKISGTRALGGGAKVAGGYFPIIKPEGSAGFKAAKDISDDVLNTKRGLLAPVTEGLRKAGLSPESKDTDKVVGAIKAGFTDKLKPELQSKSAAIYTGLVDASRDTKGVTDPRLLKLSVYSKVLEQNGISPSRAREVRNALTDTYAKLPASVQSLGNKLTSQAIKYVPGERQYLKAQSYGRFAINPFFATKVAIKSAYLGALESNGGKVLGTVDKDVQGFLRNNSKNNLGGIAEDLIGGPAGQVKPGAVGKIQENIAGNIVQNILKKEGKTVSDIATDPALKENIDHAVQMIYGYPKGGVLSSNLAKSLNVVLFPSRFEAKVLGATAKYLIDQPAVTRGVMLNGLIKMADFSNSPEGAKWKQDNSELYGLAKYFSPLDTIDKVVGVLSGKKQDASVKDLGSLGGLPFGIFVQVLQGQGVIPRQQAPYKNPKTGETIPDKLPDSTKARMSQFLNDVISSSYSYPGAVAGLPSKNSATNAAIKFGTGGALDSDKLSGQFKTVGGTSAPTKLPGAAEAPRNYKLASLPKSSAPAPLPAKPGKGKKPKVFALKPPISR